MKSERQVLLDAFERLFARAADKLRVDYTPEDLAQVRDGFADRVTRVFDLVDDAPVEILPEGTLEALEDAINQVSPVEVAGQLAALPLVQHVQVVLHQIANRATQQRLLEHALEQADTTYGGN
jgi:hypothetical protein